MKLTAEQSLIEVDHIEILVLIDNQTDSLSSTPDNFRSEWSNLHKAGMSQLSGSCQCCANHGLALLVKAYSGDKAHTVLFDAGPVDFAVEYNSTRLGARLEEVEAVVLSHGHWDHAGGLLQALDLIQAAEEKPELPVYLHPEMFRQRALPMPNEGLLPIKDIPNPQDIEHHHGTPVITDQSAAFLDNMFYVSGEIPRITSYEQGFPGHMRRSVDGTEWEPDPLIMDERYFAVNVRGKGLVVFSACSHAGIVNVMHAARNDFPDSSLHALMGGFHLSGGNEKIIEQTVDDFGQFDVDLILPGHCTGWRAVNSLEQEFGDKVVPTAVGMSITI
ncbi:MBL fold metallo-hydrolase [Sphingorhabdus sp. EL138]|uniref:MBL fold metallo-hydrolase n=1 Tax=Sphingorhabdus sp. EL138 TaxID=2073156 RepID=UPI000D686CDE|nr:MBL fold metallo-hydrolase [Sphingorhabdus sp. EL138]